MGFVCLRLPPVVRGKLISPFTGGLSGRRIGSKWRIGCAHCLDKFATSVGFVCLRLPVLGETSFPVYGRPFGPQNRVGMAGHKEKKMTNETSQSGSTEESAHTTTKVFRELVAYGGPPVLDSVVARIEARLADGWYRDREREARLWRGQSQFCFVRRSSSEFPAVALLMCAEGRSLSVTNIVADGRELSCDECNAILAEFYLKFLNPVASEAGLAMELSPDEQSLEGVFGWQASELLKSFSRCANKSRTHPADLRRWMEFLVHLYSQPNRKYDLDLLATWLLEDGWSVEKTNKLVSQCEFERDLLRVHDQKFSSIEDGERATS